METVGPHFQVDTQLVVDVYNNHPNYLIEYNPDNQNDLCAIYFSSNKIYFPNTEKTFTDAIIKKNRFEWYGMRIAQAHKHIFVRDIKKQWYLTGINSTIHSPAALTRFLDTETKGYRVITVGSSAGGYAAVLHGQLIHAKRTYCFNAQYEVLSLLNFEKNKSTNPIVFDKAQIPEVRKYYDIKEFITHPERIYYFYSNKSDWDIAQYNHIKDSGINIISFNTRTHGPPVLKCNMPALLSMKEKDLKAYATKQNHPILFSYRIVGLRATIIGLYEQLSAMIKNRLSNRFSAR